MVMKVWATKPSLAYVVALLWGNTATWESVHVRFPHIDFYEYQGCQGGHWICYETRGGRMPSFPGYSSAVHTSFDNTMQPAHLKLQNYTVFIVYS